VESTHDQKGHQGPNGKRLGKGLFESSFTPNDFFWGWFGQVKEGVLSLARLQEQDATVQCLSLKASDIHRRHMVEFLSEVGDASDFVSQDACFYCLAHSMPEYPLLCGHVLCTACAELFGNVGDRDTATYTEFCPFHHDRTERECLQIDVKPQHAGVRILCLDG
jgi:hypothetical protein